MNTPAARIAGAFLCLGLSGIVLRDWKPAFHGIGIGREADTASLTALVRGYTEKGRYQQALEPAARLHRNHPKNHIFIEQLAAIDEAIGRNGEAAALWEEYLQNAPVPVEGCPQIGIAWRKAGSVEKAVDSLKRCLGFEANNPDVLYELAKTLQMQGKNDEAEAHFHQALALAPDDADVKLALGRLDLWRGESRRAGAVAAAVLARSPENTDALLLAGLAAMRQDRLDQARPYLEKAARLTVRDQDVKEALNQLNTQEAQQQNADHAGHLP